MWYTYKHKLGELIMATFKEIEELLDYSLDNLLPLVREYFKQFGDSKKIRDQKFIEAGVDFVSPESKFIKVDFPVFVYPTSEIVFTLVFLRKQKFFRYLFRFLTLIY